MDYLSTTDVIILNIFFLLLRLNFTCTVIEIKNVRGENHVFTTRSKYATICSNNNKCRFTILKFTLAIGDFVICIYIIKIEYLTLQIIGFDITVSYINYANPTEELTTNTKNKNYII